MCPFKYIEMFEYRSKPFYFYLTFLLGCGVLLSCNTKKEKTLPSPPASDSTEIQGVGLSINYYSPGVKKRKIWGELVPHGEVWRTGANKATCLTVREDILINGQKLKAGKYALFTITSDTTWTIIFNKEWDQWGAYNYDADKDVLRLTVTPRQSDYTERMTFTFVKEGLQFEWERLYYLLKIERD